MCITNNYFYKVSSINLGGGMDQAIELLAKEGKAKLIEFNPLRSTDVELPKGATFVIANSLAQVNKADSSGGSKYNVRVAECRMATKVIMLQVNLSFFTILKIKKIYNNKQYRSFIYHFVDFSKTFWVD